LGEGGGEGRLGQIDQPVIVGRQLGRLRVRLRAVEDVRTVSPSSGARAAT
jgi:hypothetical protein